MMISKLSIEEARKGLTSRSFSCRELIESCLSVIEEKDAEIHAFLSVCSEDALKQADLVDAKIARGETIGMLEGIPYSVKDVILVEDMKATAGSRILEEFVAPYDATVIKRLKEAGAIVIGKTNCDAYGFGSSTENSDFGVTKNPHDLTRVAGGSSGGSAASVAAGMCIFSLGEDTGGSIRQPSAFCGITGLKVGYGRVSRYGSIAYASSFDSIGPMARSARDVAIVLSVIAGVDEHDHTTVSDDVPDYIAHVETEEKKAMRIGVPAEYLEGLDPAIRSVFDRALNKFRRMGHEVIDISLPHTKYAIACYYLLATSEASSNLSRLDGVRFGYRDKDAKTMEELYKSSRSYGFGPEVKRRIMLGTFALSAGHFDAYYKKAQKVRTLIRKDFDDAFKAIDVIVTPTAPSTAFKVGEKTDDPVEMYLADVYTVGFSLAGLPTVSVPCGLVDDLPVGMQISGPLLHESRVLHAAHVFESHKQS
ncbi:MAG: Asp-tRNA(Asn)/Glu-tRNA(Gln) amidotransferase subunit GatA [Candidatus Uhrbacteria bacterium]|nr:Asp-tRNA(Asn)/Glu-tRNA(Gln) amidotransferase subunit GatA [Patescibacteria group bacterium]MBU1907229.1 Asp-tRNA(Asn)/Glu-tRNA(Gln) amidotransferase subunit GatA [Patescibacteria group bacterium]